jgi:subtilisin family serine protease
VLKILLKLQNFTIYYHLFHMKNLLPTIKLISILTIITFSIFSIFAAISIDAYDSKKESSFQSANTAINEAKTKQATMIKLNIAQYSNSNKELIIKELAKNLNFKIDFLLTNLNSFVATIDQLQLSNIKKLPLVKLATPYKAYTAPVEPTLQEELATTIISESNSEVLTRYHKAIGIENSNSKNGYTGQGQVVALIDTGVDFSNPELSGKSINEACFSDVNKEPGIKSYPICANGQNTMTGIGASRPCTGLPGCNHGSHVAGIIAGRKTERNHEGIAPNAKIVAVNVFHIVENQEKCTPKLRGKFSDFKVTAKKCIFTSNFAYLKGIDFILDQHKKTPIASLNMSLGTNDTRQDNCDDDDTANFHEVINQNVALVIASGNSYDKSQMSHPACQTRVISVGAYDEALRTDVFFSNVSPKTTLFAPGFQIKSIGLSMSGTSMASPMVAGTVALLKEKGLNTVDEIKQNLINNGSTVKSSRGGYLNGKLINVAKSLSGNSVIKPAPQPITPKPNPQPKPSEPTQPTNPNTPINTNSCQSGQAGWCGTFFNNKTMSGYPVATSRLNQLEADRLTYSPAEGVNSDNFSAIFKAKFSVKEGNYHTFFYNFDDGVRVTLKRYGSNQVIIDEWRNKAPSNKQLPIFLNSGEYEISVEYYENLGGSTYILNLVDNYNRLINFYNI